MAVEIEDQYSFDLSALGRSSDCNAVIDLVDGLDTCATEAEPDIRCISTTALNTDAPQGSSFGVHLFAAATREQRLPSSRRDSTRSVNTVETTNASDAPAIDLVSAPSSPTAEVETDTRCISTASLNTDAPRGRSGVHLFAAAMRSVKSESISPDKKKSSLGAKSEDLAELEDQYSFEPAALEKSPAIDIDAAELISPKSVKPGTEVPSPQPVESGQSESLLMSAANNTGCQTAGLASVSPGGTETVPSPAKKASHVPSSRSSGSWPVGQGIGAFSKALSSIASTAMENKAKVSDVCQASQLQTPRRSGVSAASDSPIGAGSSFPRVSPRRAYLNAAGAGPIGAGSSFSKHVARQSAAKAASGGPIGANVRRGGRCPQESDSASNVTSSQLQPPDNDGPADKSGNWTPSMRLKSGNHSMLDRRLLDQAECGANLTAVGVSARPQHDAHHGAAAPKHKLAWRPKLRA